MAWDYRVVIKDGVYAVHEVYYDERGGPRAVSTDEMLPAGESFADLRLTFDLMRQALEKPALRFEEFERS